MDGAAEVGGQLQPPPGPDGEARGPVCELPQDRPAHGLPERVLCPPPAAGEAPPTAPPRTALSAPRGVLAVGLALWATPAPPPRAALTGRAVVLELAGVATPGGRGGHLTPTPHPPPAGLLRGHPVPHGDGHPGSQGPADPPVVPAGHLPPGLSAQGPGPHAGQVSSDPHSASHVLGRVSFPELPPCSSAWGGFWPGSGGGSEGRGGTFAAAVCLVGRLGCGQVSGKDRLTVTSGKKA